MPPTIVFDLDGTLVDTAPDLVDTLNVVFAREGIPTVPYEIGRNLIGGGAKRMIERALQVEGRDCSPAEVERLFSGFIEHYAAHIADRSRPFPGLIEALDQLQQRGWRFAVCTNKLEWLSVRLLDALSLSPRFEAVCGQDTFGVQKPDPVVLKRTIEQAGGDPERAIMVGDSATDINTARALGIPVVAVTFGYTEIPATELGADQVIDHYSQLSAAVEILAK
jgi:phosphoglycolate phosphatase